MKKFVFIVTNNENHWRDMSKDLKEKEISFYPKTREEFNNIRSLCHCCFPAREDIKTKAVEELIEIVKNLPKDIFCLFRYKITEGDYFRKEALFYWFYEKFLIGKPISRMIVYYEYGYECSCSDCVKKEKSLRQEAIDYCSKNNFSVFCWGEDEYLKVFTKNWEEMQNYPREELKTSDILK